MQRLIYQRNSKTARPRRRLPLPILLAAVAIIATGVAGRTMIERTADAGSRLGTFGLCTSASRQNCVVDGDTLWYGGVKIRLEDIDAPEIHSPRCAAEAALGQRATERLLQLINAGPFRMVRRGARDEDRYGRKLRVIERDGRSLAATLVAEGLARPWDGARRSWCG